MDCERRHFLGTTVALGAVGLVVPGLPAQQDKDKDKNGKPEEDVAVADVF